MTKVRRHQRCPKCNTLNVIRWGVQNGHQRFRCKECGLMSEHRMKLIDIHCAGISFSR